MLRAPVQELFSTFSLQTSEYEHLLDKMKIIQNSATKKQLETAKWNSLLCEIKVIEVSELKLNNSLLLTVLEFIIMPLYLNLIAQAMSPHIYIS